MSNVGLKFIGKIVLAATLATGAILSTGPFAVQAKATHDSWSSAAPLPNALTWTAAAVLKDKIYVMGGINASHALVASTEIYDPANNSWSAGAPLPKAIFGAAAAVAHNKLYLIGGYTADQVATNEVWAFNAKKNKWSAVAPMLSNQGSARAVVFNNIIYVIGGNAIPQYRIATVESYDPVADHWTSQPPLLVGKSELSAGLVGNTIVAADGYSTSGDTGDTESWAAGDPAWSGLKADPVLRNGACAGAIGKNLYVAGGNESDASVLVNNTNSFSLKKNSWAALAAMPKPATSTGFAIYKKQLFCIGGGSSGVPFKGDAYPDVQVYTP